MVSYQESLLSILMHVSVSVNVEKTTSTEFEDKSSQISPFSRAISNKFEVLQIMLLDGYC